MKKVIIGLLLILIPVRIFAPEWRAVGITLEEGINPFTGLWNATCHVETRHDADTINRNEQAYGIAQIRQGKLDDFNRETGKHYAITDCLDPEVSYEIYMHFASKYKPHEIEKIARKWNGSGPMTTDYWRKIREAINNPLCRCATSPPMGGENPPARFDMLNPKY